MKRTILFILLFCLGFACNQSEDIKQNTEASSVQPNINDIPVHVDHIFQSVISYGQVDWNALDQYFLDHFQTTFQEEYERLIQDEDYRLLFPTEP